MRIISLLPAATEIVAALGGMDDVVGVTHECDVPAAARTRERVTASAVEAQVPAAAIDAQVRAMAAAGAPLFALKADRIAALRPDVIFTQALCDVCAVSEGDVRTLAATLAPRPCVVALDGTTLDGVFGDIGRVAAAIGLADAGEALVVRLRERVRRVHETLAAAQAPRPRVAVIEWTEPLYAAGHWAPEMVRRAGGRDVLASPGSHSRRVDFATVVAADPEVVLFAPCGYDCRRAAAEARARLGRPEWAWARRRRPWAIDANGLSSRPGPRLVDGIETLAAILHPGLFRLPSAEQAIPLSD